MNAVPTFSPLMLPARDSTRVRLMNAFCRSGLEKRFPLGLVEARACVLAAPAGFTPDVVVTLRVGSGEDAAGGRWNIFASSRILLRAHAFFAEPELKGVPLTALPSELQAALTEKLLAPVLEHASRALGVAVRFEDFRPARPEELLPASSIAFTLEAAGCPEVVFAALSPASPNLQGGADADPFIAALEALPRLETGFLSWEGLPLAVRVVAAEMGLTMEEFVALEPGDVLLPPDWMPERSALRLDLYSDDRRIASADASLGGHVRNAEDADAGDPASPSNACMIASDFADVQEKTVMISDDLPVTVTFELENRTVTLGELKSLAPGYVFRLAVDPAAPVTIRANGRAVAKGRLVDVNGVPGVEIVEAVDASSAERQAAGGAR